MSDRLDVYRDDSGAWRWRLKAANGRTIASSGEAFSSKQHAQRAGHRATEGHGDLRSESAAAKEANTELRDATDQLTEGWPAEPDK